MPQPISAPDRNWFGDIRLDPARVVRPEGIEDVVEVVRDRERYPRPSERRGRSGREALMYYVFPFQDRVTVERRWYRKGGKGRARRWKAFLDEFNEFGSRNGGMPLLNQTPRVRPGQARQAFGSRFDELTVIGHRWDPYDRLLNPYFEKLLSRP